MHMRGAYFFALCSIFCNAMEDSIFDSADLKNGNTITVKIDNELFEYIPIELLKRSDTIANMFEDQGKEIQDDVLDLSFLSLTPKRFRDILFVLDIQHDSDKKKAFVICLGSLCNKESLFSLLYDMEFFDIAVFPELIDLVVQQIAMPQELKSYIKNPQGYCARLQTVVEKQKDFIDKLLHVHQLNVRLLKGSSLPYSKIELPHIFPNIHSIAQFNTFCFCDNMLILLSRQHIAGWNIHHKRFDWAQNCADARSLCVVKENTHIATGDIRGIVTLWNTHTGALITHIAGHADFISSLCCQPSQGVFVSGAYDKMVKIWDAHTHKKIYLLKGHTGKVHCVHAAVDGKIIASCSEDATVRLWSTDTGEQLKLMTGHTQPVRCVCFHPDGITLTSCSEDGTIRCWESNSGKEIFQFPCEGKRLEQCYYSPNGKVFVAANCSCIKIWDTAGGCILFSLLSDADSNLFFSAFTPAGDSLVALKSIESISLVIVSSARLDIYSFSELNAINTSKNFSLEQILLLHSLEQKIITPQAIKRDSYFSAIFNTISPFIQKKYALGILGTAAFKLSNTFSFVTERFKSRT